MLGILTGMPSVVCARVKVDSLLMNRVFNYQRNFTQNVGEMSSNVYMKMRYDVDHRNATLFLIPNMESLAQGERHFITESYNRLTLHNNNDYDLRRQVQVNTIPYNQRAMPPLQEFLTPTLYDICIFNDHILSPFHRGNRIVYKYHLLLQGDGTAILKFKPRTARNTQLITGEALIDCNTGRIIKTTFEGEYDMIRFKTVTRQGEDGARSLMPTTCETDAQFKFFGNKVRANFVAEYDCPVTLPDSIYRSKDRDLMDSLRPIALTEADQQIYDEYDRQHPRQTGAEQTDSTEKSKHPDYMKLIFWDYIGSNLISSIGTRDEDNSKYIWLMPILSPQYLSYSQRHGVAYKMRLKAKYSFNAHRFFTFTPTLGYNFKQKQFYFTTPLRFTYNPKRNGYVEIVYGNGNRIGNSSVRDEIEREHGGTLPPELNDLNLTDFYDNHFAINNNIMAFKWLDITSGFVFHRRKAYNPEAMRNLGKPDIYRSFAPTIVFRLRPWHKGPLITFDYERSIKGIANSNLNYERWEADASIKRKFAAMRTLSMRLGGGAYSQRQGNLFMDFTNFRDNNLPEGWNDEWTGQFQLLERRTYNESKYYVRANATFESPLLFTSFIPYLGHYIERERFYASSLLIEHHKIYTEIGYGLTTRLTSLGLFASFDGIKYKEIGCKFEFELFRRW